MVIILSASEETLTLAVSCLYQNGCCAVIAFSAEY